MAVEDYLLSVLRDDVLSEFGKDISDTNLKALAVRKINDAQHYVAKARKDWPWRLNEVVFNGTPGIAVTGDVTQGSFTILNVNPNSATHLRRILTSSSTPPGSHGFLIGFIAGASYTIQGQWMGATQAGAPLTLLQGVFSITIDFERMQVLEAMTSLGKRRFTYKSPLEFEKIKRSGDLVGNHDFIYTIKPDPLALDLTQKYMFVYPYINEYMVIQGNYWRNVPKLAADGDIPAVPVEDRLTLLHVAYWFFAQKIKEDKERVLMYKENALESLRLMALSYELGDEPNTLVDEESFEPRFILPPPGYPLFRNLG